MDLLEQLKSQLGEVMAAETAGAKGAESPSHDPHAMLESVIAMITKSGGLSGLLETLKNKGLGDVASSWISTGENKAVSAEQLSSAVGHDALSEIAAKLGASKEQAASLLAKYLPMVINHLTPNGKLEEGGILSKGLDYIKSQLGGGTKPSEI
jgi:uncharacterized protein YidB (DUF937 family)